MRSQAKSLNFIRQWVQDTQAETETTPDQAQGQGYGLLEPIAITGVSGYFPGCMDVAALWRSIDGDQSLITALPADRLMWQNPNTAAHDRPLVPKWGGFIPDIRGFDPGAFHILPLEAIEMDPRQRLLLMSTWQTLADAGLDPQLLKRSNTGVFIAGEANEYALAMSRCGFVPSMGFAQADSMLANRISYQFDFSGPSEAVNATCAGFAVALHRAVAALRMGLIERAVVGAANILLLPEPFMVLAKAGQLTAGNTVKSFGKGGDGFVRAEGVGTVLLERLSDVDRAGRSGYALIKHACVNFNGQGGVSMASPNIQAHIDLIKTCYRQARVDPCRVSYIEAQGMGLPVADIAEWTAFNRALGQLCAEQGVVAEPGFCRVSSLKPMLGHMHSASSLGALLKIIRSFQTGKIHKILAYSEPNEYCDMVGTSCRIVKDTENWAAEGGSRFAAFHAYGSGGNNAHVLLEDMPDRCARAAALDNSQPKPVFDTHPYWFPSGGDEAGGVAAVDQNQVSRVIQASLGLSLGADQSDTPFLELGLDSLSIAGFIAKLTAEFNIRLRHSDLFSYPTPRLMAKHIAKTVGDSAPRAGGDAPPARASDSTAAERDDIAIIGINLRVAGADTHQEYWNLLKEGRCAIASLPSNRLSANAAIDLKTAKGGFLEGIDTFDPLFFKISPKESESMDPRQRMLLQSAWSAIEDAGYNPRDWQGAMHGIFMGIEESDYPISEQSAITSVHSGTAPARIGYFLDTQGPVMAISTACSSSLVAVHTACRSILDGESDYALAGGCSLVCQPERTFFALSRMGNMLSPDGTCYAFDRRANGMVIGEGVGVVVLKRRQQAMRDNDPIYAVIKGSGINYDGKTNGLTAPSGSRQRDLYQSVYRKAGIRPEQISYVVCHGTGTALGDPVEGNALIDAFHAFSPDGGNKQHCALTSPKTNIGHTQAASGIVNLITAALAIHNQQIPPSLNYQQANADIDFAASPFYVNTELKSWNQPQRYAAVSSFGHTGTNAHVVLGNAQPRLEGGPPPASGLPALIVLSAKSDASLTQAAANLLECLPADLADLACTLQIGREAMDERLALAVSSIDELQSKLTQFLSGNAPAGAVHRGQAQPEAQRQEIGAAELLGLRQAAAADGGNPTALCAALLEKWVRGAVVDWPGLYGQARPRRIHLPSYPFAKEHYWLQNPATRFNQAPNALGDAASHQDDAANEVLLFEESWQPAPPPSGDALKLKTLLCVMPDGAQQQAMRQAIHGLDAQTRCIFITAATRRDYATALAAGGGMPADVDALVYAQPQDATKAGDQLAMDSLADILALLQAMRLNQLTPRRLLLGGMFENPLAGCYLDAWIGFEQSLKSLLPHTKVTVLAADVTGLDPSVAVADFAARLGQELFSQTAQSVFYADGKRLALQIRPAQIQAAGSLLRSGGTYLITGGCGAIGFQLAQHLTRSYSANSILVGRSVLDGAKLAQIQTLNSSGGRAVYVQADICNAQAFAAGLAAARQQLGAVHGVIHAAGIEGRVSVFDNDFAAFQTVLAPKIQGTLALDEVLRDEVLDFVAYFSSAAAILGDFGFCDYAIGNRFETAYARYRNQLHAQGQRHGKAVVFNWPLWKDSGMARDKPQQVRFYLETSGQRALQVAEGLRWFEQLLGQPNTQHLIMAGKPDHIRRILGLAKKGNVKSRPCAAGQASGPGSRLEECLLRDLKTAVNQLLKIAPEKLRPDSNLADFGFDSISLTDFAGLLSGQYGIVVTPALFFGHSTLNQLARYFLAEHQALMQSHYPQAAESGPDGGPASHSAQSATAQAGPVAPAAQQDNDEAIAIIGMSGRFPQARNVEEMWQILQEGCCAVTEIPDCRFDWRDYYGDPALDSRKTNGKWSGTIPGIAEFDPLFFEISPREAENMDPRQRHLLQESWNALENAGYGPHQLARQRLGTFVGVEEGDFGLVSQNAEITSNHSGILASRLAYFLDLKGPVMAINTACSSGLVAAHQACLSLRNRECDTALVGGVSMYFTAAGLVAMGQSGMLSPDGKCFVFDKRANGMVPGEAVVVMVLKRLSQAQADGDPIHATIRASGVNYDGKTNGITAPSSVAQAELLASVYGRARIDPADIEYIVTHGTGTRLGDPVEINALNAVFKPAGGKQNHCALTSTKTNFGHTFAASGLLSAVSLVEAFRHQLIPASLHCESVSEYIDWKDSPFFVNTRPKAWPELPGRKRLGAVSAFGMSGTNAHMVLEAYAPAQSCGLEPSPYYLLALSAKTRQALAEKVKAMLGFWRDASVRQSDLERISYTLLQGRHHFQWRLVIVARDVEDASLQWQQWLDNGNPPNLMQGKVPPDFAGQQAMRQYAQDLVRQSRALRQQPDAYREALCALADCYCQGYDMSWQPLFGDLTQRLSLPAYPFARESYWVEHGQELAATGGAPARLHPLLHENTSNFQAQRFRSTFTGQEFFLAAHRLHGEKILPGVSYLEMARAAVEKSLALGGSASIELSHIVWLQPFAVAGSRRDLDIELQDQGGHIGFKMVTPGDGSGSGPVVHCEGRAKLVEAPPVVELDLPALRQQMMLGRHTPAQCYAAFAAAGLEYGAEYQGLEELYVGDGQALAQVSLPASAQPGSEQFGLHPSIMDSALQASIGLERMGQPQSAARIPFALERLTILASCPQRAWVWVRRAPGSAAGGKVEKLDIDLCDSTGRAVVRMQGFSTRRITGGRASDPGMEVSHLLTGDEFYLRDHGALLPGVVSLEWARSAGSQAGGGPACGLRNVIWRQAVTVAETAQTALIQLTEAGADYVYQVSVAGTLHAQGKIILHGHSRPEPPRLSLADIQARCPGTLQRTRYDGLLHTRLGPAFDSLGPLCHNDTEALAVVGWPDCVKQSAADYLLHPSILNGMLQAANLLSALEQPTASTLFPFSLDGLWIYGAIPEQSQVYVRKCPSQGAARFSKYDMDLADNNGKVAVSIRGYAAIPAQPQADDGMVYAVPVWRQQPLAAAHHLPQGKRVEPVFVLAHSNAGLEPALAAKWPRARIEVLSRASNDEAADIQSNLLQVFNRAKLCAQLTTEFRQPVFVLLPAETDAALRAAFGGLLKNANLECAGLEGKVITYSAGPDAQVEPVLAHLAAEIECPNRDCEIRYSREGGREVLAPQEVPGLSVAEVAGSRPGDVVWITGGLGGVGRLVAWHYGVERKARLVLSGRSPLQAAQQQSLDQLRSNGVEVRYLQGDIADRNAVDDMLASILVTEGRLNGIVHCAGVIEDSYVRHKTAEQFMRVLRPKITGALALDEATRQVKLDFMLLFSSLTGSFGNPGQIDYAAANAFLDGFAEDRNRRVSAGNRSGKTVAIAWPLWRDGGMAMDAPSAMLLKQNAGMTAMATAEGIAAMEMALSGNYPQLLAFHGNAAKIRDKLFLARTPRPQPQIDSAMPPQARFPMDGLYRQLIGIVARQQKIPPEKIELEADLMQYGFNSLTFTELANQFNQAFQLELMPTLFFEHSSLKAIGNYLAKQFPGLLATQNAPASAASAGQASSAQYAGQGRFSRPADAAAVGRPSSLQPIAIVGISGRFPGCDTVEEFWRHLEANHDLVSEVPEQRWKWQDYFGDPLEQPGKTRVKAAGFMRGVDQFDAAFFGISPREAVAMDPQLRILLETAWAAIEDAGYKASALSGSQTGVFVGVSTSDYKESWLQQMGDAAGERGPSLVSHFAIANRISYTFNLRGPSEPIDTACSSSLVAIHRAIESIRQGSCDKALVCGVNIIASPAITIAASRAGMLSEDGRCKSFDSRADGYGRGEGAGVIFLKLLADAVDDGDHVYALIRGSAINHGGKASSPTAPNPAAQQQLLVKAYSNAQVEPDSVTYIEAHGTGTELGDPIEVNGLKNAFEELYRCSGLPMATAHCGLGSVKTNVGHLEAAAGIAGVLKVLMMLKHRKIPGNVHLRQPNPYLQLEGTPFYLVKDTQEWPARLDQRQQPLPRRAGISSFGIGGSNAHVILEEYGAVGLGGGGADCPLQPPFAIILSAKNTESLKAMAGNLLRFLQTEAAADGGPPSLAELAYTLQAGREDMAVRLGFMADSVAQAIAHLKSYLSDESNPPRQVSRATQAAVNADAAVKAQMQQYCRQADFAGLLDLWLRGLEIDWQLVWSAGKPRHLSLPSYAFKRNRYWFDEKHPAEMPEQSAKTVGSASLPPVACPAQAQPVAPERSPADQASDDIEQELVNSLAGILYMEPAEIDCDSSFVDMGLDSVVGVEWIQLINKRYGLQIASSKLYDYPNIQTFSQFLVNQINRPSKTAMASEQLLADTASVAQTGSPTRHLTLDEILEQVENKLLDVEHAEQLIKALA
jgi:polyketide synthase PksN